MDIYRYYKKETTMPETKKIYLIDFFNDSPEEEEVPEKEEEVMQGDEGSAFPIDLRWQK